MSKRAEEKAQEYEDSLDYYHYTGDEPSVAYTAGYQQAEKDLALTKEDVRTIFNLVRELQAKYSAIDGCLQEVADIFNEQRKK